MIRNVSLSTPQRALTGTNVKNQQSFGINRNKVAAAMAALSLNIAACANDADRAANIVIQDSHVIFNRLTTEEINAVNKAGLLPKNAKFAHECYTPKDAPSATCEWKLKYAVNNFLGKFVKGTREMPAGHELRKDIIGFTEVVPKDKPGWFNMEPINLNFHWR